MGPSSGRRLGEDGLFKPYEWNTMRRNLKLDFDYHGCDTCGTQIRDSSGCPRCETSRDERDATRRRCLASTVEFDDE